MTRTRSASRITPLTRISSISRDVTRPNVPVITIHVVVGGCGIGSCGHVPTVVVVGGRITAIL